MSLKDGRLTRAVQRLGEKCLEKSVDIVLVSLFYNLELALHSRSEWWKLDEKVGADFEKVNYETIKRAFNYLRRKGLIQFSKEKKSLPKITEAGKKKLNSILPRYDDRRIWDGRIYMITYDLPIKKNKERNYLRVFLRKIGCGLLQKSVWITPYNPTQLLEEFVKERDLEDLILVSSLGKDGTIGGMELPDLIERVYQLSRTNREYLEFINDAQKGKTSKDQLVFRYLSILSGDPQLPFALLPDWWVGDKAYHNFLQALDNRLN